MTASAEHVGTVAGPHDRTDAYCVIGAGSSGLAALKNLREQGFQADCFEREPELGGNWNFAGRNARIYASVHTISSKPFTQYPDFPMPDDYPDYPHHTQLFSYLWRYAEHFGLLDHIRLDHEILRVTPAPGTADRWDVTYRGPDGFWQTARYAGVVVANGHNWHPKLPEYPGLDSFTGEVCHSAQYKSADLVRGRRVLVVGAGNTGCDLAVESAQNAAVTWHCTRRGYWYAPKYALGRPADQAADFWLGIRAPLKLRQWLFRKVLDITVGDLTRYGLPEPDHAPFETHPIVNSQLVYYVAHGDIQPRPDIAHVDGGTVTFLDGSTADPDLILLCTGYLARFEFLDEAHLNWTAGRPLLYQHIFTPRHQTLAVAGLIQPDSGQFTLTHWQTMAIAAALRARHDAPARYARFRRRVLGEPGRAWSGGARYASSTRHYYEVAHHDYLRGLEKTINSLGGVR
ncbi:MAG TPA: NAD(P)-binding domain-containing protein [Cryptosporangiaceae bacterium]|nr:NAD(P)-binding domain-containing protein [Cryptosporangiaceae bacterium]